MAIGVSVGDIVALCKLAHDIGKALYLGPKEVRELADQLELFKDAFETLKYWEKDIGNPDKLKLSTEQANYVTDIRTSSSNCLKEIETFVRQNGGYDEHSGIKKAWKAIKAAYNQDAIDKWLAKMTFQTLHINQFKTDLLVTNLIILKERERMATVIGRSFKLQRTNILEQNEESGQQAGAVSGEQLVRVLRHSNITQSSIDKNTQFLSNTVRLLRRKALNILVYDGSSYTHLGIMFKSILKRVIDNDMVEDYGSVVSNVTLCTTRRRFSKSDQALQAISISLSRNGNIQFNPEEDYKYWKSIQYQNFNIGICIADHIKMRDFLMTQNHLHTINLEPLAWDVRDGWRRWTVPCATETNRKHKKKDKMKEEQENYKLADEEVEHCVRKFARDILYCTPKGGT